MMITHMVYVEKYKTFEENKMLKILEAADDELTALLEKNGKVTNWTKGRQEKLLEAIKALEEGYSQVFYDEITGDLKAFGEQEGGWIIDKLREATNPYVSFDFVVPSAAQIYAAAEASFLIMNNGMTLDLESMINSVFGTRAQIIEQSLRQGFILGKPIDQMVRELMGTEAMNFYDGNMQRARGALERIVRTAFSHMSGVSRNEVYSRNDDLVKGYKWCATLDSRTSPTCIAYDGRTWYYDKDNAPSGASLLPGNVTPPAHYSCRSTTVPVLKSWKELGINIAEAPEGTRSALDGYVPASTTYSEWFDKAGEKVQRDVLGAARYEMYKSGEMKVTQFMKDGSWLSLEQLKQRGH